MEMWKVKVKVKVTFIVIVIIYETEPIVSCAFERVSWIFDSGRVALLSTFAEPFTSDNNKHF